MAQSAQNLLSAVREQSLRGMAVKLKLNIELTVEDYVLHRTYRLPFRQASTTINWMILVTRCPDESINNH